MKKWLSSIMTLLMLGYIQSLELKKIMESVQLVKHEVEVVNTITNSTGHENSLPDPDVSTVKSTRAIENITNEIVSSVNDEGVTETKHEDTGDIAILAQDKIDNGTTTNDGVTNIDIDETMARNFLDLLVKDSNDDANVGVFVGHNENIISGKPGFNTKMVTTTRSVLRMPEEEISSLPTKADEGSKAYVIIWFCYSGTILIISVVMLLFVGTVGKVYLRRKRVKDVCDIKEKQKSDIVTSFQSFPTDGDIWREMKLI